MLEVTKEEFDTQYKKYYGSIAVVGKLLVIMVAIDVFCFLFLDRVFSGFLLTGIWCVLFLADIFFIVYVSYCNKKYIPKQLKLPRVKKLMEQLKYDISSDAVLQALTDAFAKTDRYDEKIYIASLLASVYGVRGQFHEAVAVMRSIDHSQLEKYPETALSYFADYMEIYAALEDWDSVIAIYKDAEPYFRRYYNQNYVYCMSVVDSLILLNQAYGNHEKALKYQLMRMEQEERTTNAKTNGQNMTMLKQCTKANQYYKTAICYYNCKDYQNAAKYLNKGAALFTITPYLANQANQLSAELQKNLGATNTDTQAGMNS